MDFRFTNTKIQVVIIFLAVSFAIMWPFLFGNEAIAERFTPFHLYPILSFEHQALNNGIAGNWLPGYMSGYPVLVGPFSYYFPVTIFIKLFDFLTVFNWLTLLSFFFGALFMYMFARRLNLSRQAAIVAGLAYAFSQLSVWWASIFPFSFMLPIVPLLFISVWEIFYGSRWYILVGALTLAFGWLNAFDEYMLYLCMAIAAFTLFLTIKNWKKSVSFFKNTVSFWLTAAMGIIGSLLAVPKLAQVLNFIPLSARNEGASSLPNFIGLGDLIRAIYPYINNPYPDLAPIIADHELYLHFTFPIFLLAIISLFCVRRIARENKIIWFFWGLGAASFLMMTPFTGIYPIFLKITLHLFRGSWKLLFLGNLVIAILAGLGLDYFKNINKKKLAFWIKVFLFIFILGVLVINVGIYVAKGKILAKMDQVLVQHITDNPDSQPLAYYQALTEKTFQKTFGVFLLTNYHFDVWAGFIFIFSFLVYLFADEHIGYRKFKNLAVLVMALNFSLLWQDYYISVPKKLITEIPKSVEFLKSYINSDNPFRIFRFWPGYSAYYHMGLDRFNSNDVFDLNKELLTSNMNITYGVYSIEGDEHFMSYREAKVLAYVGSFKTAGISDDRWIYSDDSVENKLKRFESQANQNMLSMMNVRFVETSFPLETPWKKVFETQITSANLPLFIYENTSVLPRVYLANGIDFVSGTDEQVFDKLKEDKNFKNKTIIECSSCADMLNNVSSKDKIEISDIKPGYVKISADVKNSRWLIYSEANLPTWKAQINSIDAPIYTANYLYQAVYLPAGKSEVIFQYPGILEQTKYAVLNQLNKFK